MRVELIRRSYALRTVIVLLTVLGVLGWRTHGFIDYTYESIRRSAVERDTPVLSNWHLENDRESNTTLDDFGNETLLVDFIYTRCPTVCRALGSRYHQLQRFIRAQGLQSVQLLSISIDPSYDTPRRLAQYRRQYRGDAMRWQLARPSGEQTLENILAETGLVVIEDQYGGFTHSDSIHIIHDRRLIAIVDWQSEQLAQWLIARGRG